MVEHFHYLRIPCGSLTAGWSIDVFETTYNATRAKESYSKLGLNGPFVALGMRIRAGSSDAAVGCDS